MGPAPSKGEIEAAYRQHVGMVRSRAYRLCGNRAVADDMTHETFIAFMSYVSKKQVNNVPGLLYQIVTRSALKRLRAVAQSSDTFAEAMHADTRQVAPEDRLLFKRVLAAVNEESALIAVYYHVDGLTQDEVAAVMGIPRRTVARRLEAFTECSQRVVHTQTPGRSQALNKGVVKYGGT